MSTVLLISPPVLHGDRWWANRLANKPHLASLAGAIRDFAAVRTIELDRVAGAPLGPLLDVVTTALPPAVGPDVGLVAISCWTSMHYLGACAVARHVRALAPHVPIVVGGHHPTARPDDFDATVADYLVRHDGEHALRDIVCAGPARQAAMRVIEGGVFDQTDPRHIDWDRYLSDDLSAIERRAIWVGTSRGCAFKCRFCVEPDRGAKYSRYEVDAQIDILERLVARYEPRNIAFSDPLFGANRAWLEAFLERLVQRELPVKYWCETRADLMSPELLEGFLRAGFMVDFGLDTASATMVSRMEKSTSPEKYLARARTTLAYANRIGLHHGVYIVFNFPGETPETTRETQAWIESLGAHDGQMSGWLSCQTFFILPGTRSYAMMRENAERYGAHVAHPEWWRQSGDHYALATANLPSAKWSGREHELREFQAWNQAINAAWSARYPPEVMDFRVRFYVG